MKGLISGIKRMEIHDGDGLRTTVFFKGCPLRCIWCHNPESISFEKQVAFFAHKCLGCGACQGIRNEETAKGCVGDAITLYGEEYLPEELASLLLRDEPFFRDGGGGVTLSGGECLAQPEFALALAKLLNERGISVYVDTCGYVKKEILEAMIPYTDRFLYDIKAIDPDVHKACTGRDNRIILDNLRFLCERGCSVEIRYPLVMGCNDGECHKIGEFLSSLPAGIVKVKVLQYHSFARSRYEALGMAWGMPECETSVEDVDRAVQILKGFGLNAVNGAREN